MQCVIILVFDTDTKLMKAGSPPTLDESRTRSVSAFLPLFDRQWSYSRPVSAEQTHHASHNSAPLLLANKRVRGAFPLPQDVLFSLLVVTVFPIRRTEKVQCKLCV